MFALAMIVRRCGPRSCRRGGADPAALRPVERCYLVPKRAGLVIWPAAGLAVAGVLGGIAASSLATGWVPGVRYVLAPAATGVLLAFEAGALAMARRAGVSPARRGGAGAGNLGPVRINGCDRQLNGPYHLHVPNGHAHLREGPDDRQQSGPGMRDLLPADVAVRDHVLESISRCTGDRLPADRDAGAGTHRPAEQRRGGDNEKLIFEVLRRGLPLDVPLARRCASSSTWGCATT